MSQQVAYKSTNQEVAEAAVCEAMVLLDHIKDQLAGLDTRKAGWAEASDLGAVVRELKKHSLWLSDFPK